MSDYRRGSLAWQISRMHEEKRQLQCNSVFIGWHEASAGYYANRSAVEILAIDEEIAEAVNLLRKLGIVRDVIAELDERVNETLGTFKA